MLRPPRLIFAELKTEAKTSKTTPEQDEWLSALAIVGEFILEAVLLARRAQGSAEIDLFENEPSVEVYVWRPGDWDDVVEILTGHRPREPAARAA